MGKIFFRWRDGDKRGSVCVEAKNEIGYYYKYGVAHKDCYGCGQSTSEKDARYVKWMDYTGYIRSGHAHYLKPLLHKRPSGWWRRPEGFDHDSEWRKKGDRWPLFSLTEPYHIEEEIELYWNELCIEDGLSHRIFEPSQKSLWVPDGSYMVFWWCPRYFTPDFDLLMGHKDSEEIKKEFIYG